MGICRSSDGPCRRCRGGGGSRSPRRRRDHRHHPRFGPPALCTCPRPSSVGMGEGKIAAAPTLRPALLRLGDPERGFVVVVVGTGGGEPPVSLLLLRRPSPIEWGCSYLRRWNRSSVCNGTLNASVFVHCGCRGLNMYVISARSRVFSSFSSTKSRLLIICTTSPSMSRPVSR